MSWTDSLTPWAAEAGFCADCLKTGRPCPDHARQGTGPAGWTVEGVVRCPGECGLYFDFCGTPHELQEFISEHDCAFARPGEELTS